MDERRVVSATGMLAGSPGAATAQDRRSSDSEGYNDGL